MSIVLNCHSSIGASSERKDRWISDVVKMYPSLVCFLHETSCDMESFNFSPSELNWSIRVYNEKHYEYDKIVNCFFLLYEIVCSIRMKSMEFLYSQIFSVDKKLIISCKVFKQLGVIINNFIVSLKMHLTISDSKALHIIRTSLLLFQITKTLKYKEMMGDKIIMREAGRADFLKQFFRLLQSEKNADTELDKLSLDELRIIKVALVELEIDFDAIFHGEGGYELFNVIINLYRKVGANKYALIFQLRFIIYALYLAQSFLLENEFQVNPPAFESLFLFYNTCMVDIKAGGDAFDLYHLYMIKMIEYYNLPSICNVRLSHLFSKIDEDNAEIFEKLHIIIRLCMLMSIGNDRPALIQTIYTIFLQMNRTQLDVVCNVLSSLIEESERRPVLKDVSKVIFAKYFDNSVLRYKEKELLMFILIDVNGVLFFINNVLSMFNKMGDRKAVLNFGLLYKNIGNNNKDIFINHKIKISNEGDITLVKKNMLKKTMAISLMGMFRKKLIFENYQYHKN